MELIKVKGIKNIPDVQSETYASKNIGFEANRMIKLF